MRGFTILMRDVARCPKHSLAAQHYNDDGTCRCPTERTDDMVIINPGSGPVEGATLQNAQRNMLTLVIDCQFTNAQLRHNADGDGDDGRYAFVATDNYGREREVDMPGLPLDRVRYIGAETQDIWDFPRLYVDGSSWVWKYAVNVLTDEPDEDDA